MFIVRNVPTVERVVRVVSGVAMLIAAVVWLGFDLKGWIIGAAGLMASLSGLIGWCPMCALAGRKLRAP